MSNLKHAPRGDTRKLRADVEAYRAELAALEPDELNARYVEELAKQADYDKQKAEQEERERYFNRPNANADFEHWAKAAHWTLDEAIALSFGKAPEVVKWEHVKAYIQVSPFAFAYNRRRDLALRAVPWKQLFDPVLPGTFLAWAKRNDLVVPPELEAAVTARGGQIADWKALYDEATETAQKHISDWKRLYDELKAHNEEQEKRWRVLVAKKDELIERVKARADGLSAQLVVLGVEKEKLLASRTEKEKSLGAKDRDSLLKLVIGMAVEGYRYDPTATRSPQVSEIASDLERAGLPLEADTVRKWLRQAAELLPPRDPGQK